jgi:probable HAF family extracellular repeat protein
LGSESGVATAVNNHRQVVGDLNPGTGSVPFLWNYDAANPMNGSTAPLPRLILPPGVTVGSASNINDGGLIVGSIFTTAGEHACVWIPAVPNGPIVSMMDLAKLPGGAEESHANGINALGYIVGESQSAAGMRAVIWTTDKVIHDLNDLVAAGVYMVNGDQSPGASFILRDAEEINDLGQIVGYGDFYPSNGGMVQRPFLLTPVPEPASIMLLVTGSAVLLCAQRNRTDTACRHQRHCPTVAAH